MGTFNRMELPLTVEESIQKMFEEWLKNTDKRFLSHITKPCMDAKAMTTQNVVIYPEHFNYLPVEKQTEPKIPVQNSEKPSDSVRFFLGNIQKVLSLEET